MTLFGLAGSNQAQGPQRLQSNAGANLNLNTTPRYTHTTQKQITQGTMTISRFVSLLTVLSLVNGFSTTNHVGSRYSHTLSMAAAPEEHVETSRRQVLGDVGLVAAGIFLSTATTNPKMVLADDDEASAAAPAPAAPAAPPAPEKKKRFKAATTRRAPPSEDGDDKSMFETNHCGCNQEAAHH